MKKSVTIITTCFVAQEDVEGPSTVAITLTASDVERIEKYISAMADLKKNGLNPSVIDTHDIPRVDFLAEGACNISPLNPDEYIQLMFLDNEAKKRFDELFTDEANPEEFSTLEDCVYDSRIDTPKLKIRHDDLIWIDGYGKYDGVRVESEGFGLEFLAKVKKELGIEAPAEGVDDPIEYAQEKYRANPYQCPHCESDDIEGGSVEVDASMAWQPITCNECGATWNDTYKLTGYSELETND